MDRVRRLVESGDAAWCPAIRLELWNEVGDESDRRILRDLLPMSSRHRALF